MDLGLKDKVALVAAASRGLGKAAAKALAQEGAKVSIFSRTEQIHDTAQEIHKDTGMETRAFQADVRDAEAIEAVVAQSIAQFGQIDILIVNAGGPALGGFTDLGPKDWQSAIELTVMSAVNLCYSVVPHMIEQNSGSIVATESYSIKHPIENLILSNSLRLSVIGMLKSMANELGPQGIRVNSINPGWTMTDRVQQLMVARAARNNRTVEEEAEKVVEYVPLGRMATLEEYGRTIAWLASPAASFIHGHALMFDGGATRPAL